MRTSATISTLALFHRLWITWRGNWKNFIFLRIVEPTILLYGMGFGLGLAFQEVGGFPYLNFVVPGIMCTGLMFSCVLDGIYGTLTRELYQGTWKSQLATNITLPQILMAEAFWVGFKGSVATTLVMGVGYAFGGVANPWTALQAFPLLLLGGMALTSFGQVFASRAYSYTDVEPLWALIISPMFIFSSTFIPIESFPNWIQFAAHFLPLIYVVELVRGTLLEMLTLQTFLTNTAVLVALIAVTQFISHKSYRKRIFS